MDSVVKKDNKIFISIGKNNKSYADGGGGEVQAPSREALDALIKRKQDVLNGIQYEQSQADSDQDKYNRRDNCGGLKKACSKYLSTRDQHNRNVATLQKELDNLNNTLIPNAQQAYDASVVAYQKTNPDLVKIASDNQIQSQLSKNKTTIIIIAIIAVVLLVGVILYKKFK